MSNRIPQAFINDIIARTDIIELIEARIKITKKGQNYSGLCPFHNEKSPSFSVNAQKQFYYCFGCGASGNAIGFLMAFDHMEFIDAVTDLSAKLGVEVPRDSSEKQHSYERDYELLTKASDFYQQQLRQSEPAITYLKSRGLSGQIAKKFLIGYSPDQWDSLIKHTANESDALDRLTQHGMVIQKDGGKCYDRFRNRIMFPIRDHRGRVIAFGARALGDDLPKYLNSPETPLFHKSQELYGLFEVLEKNHHPKSILIVEGYMDVIALHQYGITNAVATLGTATNPKHLQKLFRYTNEVIFCFDGDNAGRNAAWKALTLNLPLMRDGIQLRFMFLPKDDDPDTLVRRLGSEGFIQRLKRAASLSYVFFDLIKQEVPPDTPDTKALYAKKASDYLNKMPKGLFRELMFKQLAKELHVYLSDLNGLQSSPGQRKVQYTNQTLLTPAQKATALLLQESKLSLECDINQLSDLKALPGAELLIKLLQLLSKNQKLSVGELMAMSDDEDEKRAIAELAAHRHPFPVEGMLLEFSGAIARLQENYLDHLTNDLIIKAKQNELSPDEKKKLSALLTQRQKDLI